jgi:hypothetical protein
MDKKLKKNSIVQEKGKEEGGQARAPTKKGKRLKLLGLVPLIKRRKITTS